MRHPRTFSAATAASRLSGPSTASIAGRAATNSSAAPAPSPAGLSKLAATSCKRTPVGFETDPVASAAAIAARAPSHVAGRERGLGEVGVCERDERVARSKILLPVQNRRRRGETATATGEAAFALAKVLWMQPSQRTRAIALIEEAQALWKKDGTHEAEAERWIAEHHGAVR